MVVAWLHNDGQVFTYMFAMAIGISIGMAIGAIAIGIDTNWYSRLDTNWYGDWYQAFRFGDSKIYETDLGSIGRAIVSEIPIGIPIAKFLNVNRNF